jgi:SAM-dependent methyltransferase
VPRAVRLDPQPERQEAELRAYLGDAYSRERLEHHRELLDAEAKAASDERELYRTSEAYLYDLTVFAMSGTKIPYLEALTRVLEPGARVLDYGCGIGSDGLLLLDAGYRVEFADFQNPSTAYLRWRLAQRGIDAPVYDLEGDVPGGFDAAYAFDVIEHVPDPYAFLREMEQRAALVEVNLLEFEPHEQELHYELPIGEMLGYVASRGLVHYRVHYGSSHLVLYRPEAVGVPRALRNRAVVAAERARQRVARLRGGRG